MGAGILIDYLDGTRPIEVTSGMQVPSWLATVTEERKAGNQTVALPGRIPGSSIMLIPSSTAVDSGVGIAYLTGFVDNGSSLTLQMASTVGDDVSRVTTNVSIFQLPPEGSTAGLLLQGGANFTLITTEQACCRVLFQGRITFNGTWTIPTYEGIDPHKVIIAAHWTAPGVAVARSSTRVYVTDPDVPTLTAYAEGKHENRQPRDVTLDIIVYGPGFPEAGNAGMAVWNARGQCVFSTNKRPLIVKERWTKSRDATNVDGMIVLDMPGYWVWRPGGGGTQFQNMGYVRNGLSLSVQPGEVTGFAYAYPDNSIVSPLPTLILPPLY